MIKKKEEVVPELVEDAQLLLDVGHKLLDLVAEVNSPANLSTYPLLLLIQRIS